MALIGTEFIAGRAMVGTVHQRRGDQYLRTDPGVVNGAWGRVFGQSTDQRWSGTVSPEFDGTVAGFQTGVDLYSYDGGLGHGSLGVFVAYSNSNGSVLGFADAVVRSPVGALNLENVGFGATWTHVGQTGWYLDALVMGQVLSGNATSARGIGIQADGSGFVASIEAGYPIALQSWLTFEPQAQFIWQRIDFDAESDVFSSVGIGAPTLSTGRLGARLQGTFRDRGVDWRPYLLANLWHNFNETSLVTFDTVPLSIGLGGTSLEVGGGVVARINPNFGIFGQVSYAEDINGTYERTIQGELGLRLTW